MLMNIAGHKTNLPLNVVGVAGVDNIVVPGVAGQAIFVYELIGSLSADATLTLKSGTTSLATPALKANQGITFTAVPELEGEPRFICKPGDSFIMTMSANSTFTGNLYYAMRS